MIKNSMEKNWLRHGVRSTSPAFFVEIALMKIAFPVGTLASALFLFFFLAAAPLAWAEDSDPFVPDTGGSLSGGGRSSYWLLSAGSVAGLSFETGSNSKTSTMEFSGGIGHKFFANTEILFLATYLSSSPSGLEKSSAYEIDGQLNFLAGQGANAFYLGARVGTLKANPGSAASTVSATVVGVAAGKRFALAKWVAYDPNFSYCLNKYSNNLGTKGVLRFVPIQFTFVI